MKRMLGKGWVHDAETLARVADKRTRWATAAHSAVYSQQSSAQAVPEVGTGLEWQLINGCALTSVTQCEQHLALH